MRLKALYSILFIFILVLFAPKADAVPIGVKLTYEGKGAGEIVFDGSIHAAKGFSCSECHEGRGLMPALFEMKKNSGSISMRKMEMGLSCGKCHPVSMSDTSSCSHCHHK